MSQWEEVPNGEGFAPENGWEPAPRPGSVPADIQYPVNTSPTQGWGSGVERDEDNPFGGVQPVDGLVYSPEAASPELQWQQQPINVPPPPRRERPQPIQHQHAEPWKPGPDPAPVRPKGTSAPVRVLAVTLVPLMIFAGLALVVYRVMQAYGYST